MESKAAMGTITERWQRMGLHYYPVPQSYSFIAAVLLLPLALMLPPHVLSKQALSAIFLPLIFACVIHAWTVMQTIDVIGVDILLWSLKLLAFEDVRKDFRRIRPRNFSVNDTNDKRTVPTAEEAYPNELLQRLKWVGVLTVSIRLSGWKTSPNSRAAPLKPHPSRTRFMLEIIPKLTASISLFSFTTLMTAHDPYFNSASTVSIFSPYPSPPEFQMLIITLLQILPPPFLRSMVIGFALYSAITLQYFLNSPIYVLSNYLFNFPSEEWSPHTIDPMFGPFSSVFTSGMRGVWGIWWHQQMRVVASGPGVALAKALGWKNTAAGFVLQVLSAFFFSGVVHAGLVPPFPLGLRRYSVQQVQLLLAAFFWMQPAALFIEVGAENVLRRMGVQSFQSIGMRVLRFAWVLAWLCLTLPVLGVAIAELGYWTLVPPGFPFQAFWGS